MKERAKPLRWTKLRRDSFAARVYYVLRQAGVVIATVAEASDGRGWYWHGYGRNSLTLDEYKEHRGTWSSPKTAKDACRRWLREHHAELWREA